jgi:glyoxylase-like metal-dependent hydrolase (beta-lactamase superfamily II)
MHRNSTDPLTLRRPGRFEVAPRIGALYEAAPDIAGLRYLISNVYFVGAPNSAKWTLIDAGLSGAAAPIIRAAAQRFGDTPPQHILLTHGHFDHVGAVRTLADHWRVDIFANSLELPYLTGRSSYPPPDPVVGGGAMAWLASLYPKKPIDLGDRVKALPADGTVPGFPEWRWFHTPGHTAGHVSFFREADRALIAGDAFVTTRQESAFAVMQQTPELNGPPAYFTQDWQAARASVEHLASLNPDIVAPGHGIPLRGERMRQELHELAANFDSVARPPRGRYVTTPAAAGLNGTISVPPPTALQTTLTYCGAALLAAAVAGLVMKPRFARDE